MSELGTQPKNGDVISDVRGETLPFVVGNVHEFDRERDAWHVSTPEGVSGYVRWDLRYRGWTWAVTV